MLDDHTASLFVSSSGCQHKLSSMLGVKLLQLLVHI
jgi:hypothetical protein